MVRLTIAASIVVVIGVAVYGVAVWAMQIAASVPTTGVF